jgi:hypothetical protein
MKLAKQRRLYNDVRHDELVAKYNISQLQGESGVVVETSWRKADGSITKEE